MDNLHRAASPGSLRDPHFPDLLQSHEPRRRIRFRSLLVGALLSVYLPTVETRGAYSTQVIDKMIAVGVRRLRGIIAAKAIDLEDMN